MEDRVVGIVTSGSPSPTLGHPIAMGYIESSLATIGLEVEVDIRGSRHGAQIVELPSIDVQASSPPRHCPRVADPRTQIPRCRHHRSYCRSELSLTSE
ncbi:MAG: glycine cleavage T C-terminal barrel domain-containing protein [Pirellulaceae bacterium]